jgi:hypothetical protein
MRLDRHAIAVTDRGEVAWESPAEHGTRSRAPLGAILSEQSIGGGVAPA